MFSSRSIWYCLSVLAVLTRDNNVLAEEDHYTSITGLEELFETESFLLDELQSYIDATTLQLDVFRNKMVEIKMEHSIAASGLEEYLTNPVNAYRLINRLDRDWYIYEDSIRNENHHQAFMDAFKFARDNLTFSNKEDLKGSALALVRLQDTYQLNVSQVAAGFLNGVKYGSPMSWEDCFQLGHQLFIMKDFNHTIPWLKESYQKLMSEDYDHQRNSSEIVEILETLAFYHFQMGDYKTVVQLMDKLLELDAEHVIDLNNYLEAMAKEENNLHLPLTHLQKYFATNIESEQPFGIDGGWPIVDDPTSFRSTNKFKTYEKICRGEIKPDPWEEKDLRCKFFHRDVPYRFLMPFKIEEINLDPYFVVFHDVIYDSEIEAIIKAATPTMTRSKVIVSENDFQSSMHRTSQNSWLEFESLPQTMKISQRLGDITGLDMEANEKLQVANYVFGGHYEPHYDYFDFEDVVEGNRIATALFYLSDSTQGGATAFVHLKKAVQPRKGSMLLWYNLYKSGERDNRTMHAGCPVLKGLKTIANVWIRAGKQIFNRPCGLQPDHEVSRK